MAATLDDYGWEAWRSAAPSHADPIPERPPAGVGRVVRIDRGVYAVVTADDVVAASIAGELKDAADPVLRPAIGDWVIVAHDGDDAVVRVVLARRSMFVRGDIARMQAQVVAANVDVVFVVHSASDEPNLRRLERELVLAFQSGAQPVIVLSKADLARDAERVVEAIRPASVGLDIVVTSAVSGAGVDALASYGADASARILTLAFIGASGVGKSTLVNALLGSDVQATAPIRVADGKGRHTTTARELFLLPHGGVLVDTPGLRSLGMWRSDEGIAAAFADIEELAGSCRFSNCGHDQEPGCAVIEAVAAGRLEADRVRNHRDLQRELDRLDAEAEARGRVVKQQERVARARAQRSAPPAR
ncbi:MAG TPA: ribosome small subunit-dependent GTPase A [Acidimicrobiia bacterium]